MMLAKLWCDHAEGFEAGLRALEVDVREWDVRQELLLADAVKFTLIMYMAPNVLGNSLQLCTYANSAAIRSTLVQWCYSSRNIGANPTVSAGNGTGADDDSRMQVDFLKKGKGNGKGKHQHQKGNRTNTTQATRATQTSTRARIVAELDIGRKTARDQVEEPTTYPPVTKATHRKARTT